MMKVYHSDIKIFKNFRGQGVTPPHTPPPRCCFLPPIMINFCPPRPPRTKNLDTPLLKYIESKCNGLDCLIILKPLEAIGASER